MPNAFYFLFLRAGGADGAIARGGAPQSGAQPRVMERKKIKPWKGVRLCNKRDDVPSPLPGLLILLLFIPGVARCFAALHPGLLLLWRLQRKKVNGIGRDANAPRPGIRRTLNENKAIAESSSDYGLCFLVIKCV